MKPLILAIIKNEGLSKEILVNEVIQFAVALYNAKEGKSRDPEKDMEIFEDNCKELPHKPKTALDMI